MILWDIEDDRIISLEIYMKIEMKWLVKYK